MAPARDLVTTTTLLTYAARFAGLPTGRFSSAYPLDALELSTFDFMALVRDLEDQCGVVLADFDLARCETLGDLINRLRGLAAPNAPALCGRADGPADVGRQSDGQLAPDRDPTHNASRRRAFLDAATSPP